MNVIITGASKGLGKAFAQQFAAANHTLLLCARNEATLLTTAAEIKLLYTNCTIHTKAVDLSNKKAVIAFGNWCLSIGVPDILINNAGQFIPGSVHNEADGILEQMIQTNLYSAYLGLDCAMLEINPLFKTSDEKIIAVDCKMGLDENALMRHPDLAALRDVTEEDPTEVEAGQFNLNFVKLDGNVGCMVNGAGLAMATMDMIKLSGGEPANFLDVGGDRKSVV